MKKKSKETSSKYTSRIKELRNERDLEAREMSAIKNKIKSNERKEILDKIKKGKELGLPTETYEEQLYGTKDQRNIKQVKIGFQIAGNKVAQGVSKTLKKPLFTKPHLKVKTISNKALARNLASGNYTMFKSEGRDYSQAPEQDNRSLFFQSELNKAKDKALSGGWL